MSEKLLKYEFTQDVVKYLQSAVESQQIRGTQQAQSLINVMQMLAKPANVKDLEKEALETLKERYEKPPVATPSTKKGAVAMTEPKVEKPKDK